MSAPQQQQGRGYQQQQGQQQQQQPMMGSPMMYPGVAPYGVMRPGSAPGSDNASVGSAGSAPSPVPGVMNSPGSGPMNMQQMPAGRPYYPSMPYYPHQYYMNMAQGGPGSVSGDDGSAAGSPGVSPSMGPMQPNMYYQRPPNMYPQQMYFAQAPMAAPQQQQHQQQQAAAPVKKEKKILEIIDPKTKKAVLPSPTHKEAEQQQQQQQSASTTASTNAGSSAANNTANGTGAAGAAKPKSNIMLEALQQKLKQEAADAESLERQRKEADAKAQLEEQQRVADEKRKKLQEEEEQAEKQRKEAELKRKADQADEERKKRDQELLKQQEMDAAAAASSNEDSEPVVPVQVKRNETGKIVYEVAELMGFKTRFRDCPSELDEITFDIVPVRPPLARGNSAMGGNRRAFDNMNGPRDQRGGGGQWNRGGGGGGRGAPGGPRGPPLGPGGRPLPPPPNMGMRVAPLKTTEKGWKPKAAANELEGTIKKVNGILNKLTLEKFERLSKQMLEIPMKSVKMLKETMAAIFDKALAEPKFGELYADLCRVIVESKAKGHEWDFVEIVENDGKYYWTASDDTEEPDEDRLMGPYDSEEKAREVSTKMTDFKRILLNKCQEEFEKETQIQEAEALVEKLKEEFENESDADKKAEVKEKFSDAKYEAIKIKRKVLGNIQFIGELFKKKILTEKVMHSCIIKILNPKQEVPEEEDLECLCKLLTTIGATLDSSPVPRTKQLVEEYFAKMRRIASNKKLDARHRFMIMDVIDLRSNKWQARREELKAKKIEDVHKDAAREEQEKARQAARSGAAGGRQGAAPARGGAGFGRDRGAGRSGAGAGPMIQQVAKGSAMGTTQGYKIGGGGAAKIGGARPAAGGPAGGAGGLRAAAGGAMRPGGAAGSFRPGASGAGIQRPPALGTATARPSGRFAPGGSNAGKAGASNLPRSTGPSGGAQPKRKVAAIDTETMENKVRGALEEYVHLNMASELVESFTELVPQVESEEELKLFIIKQACHMIVEKKDAERRHVPEALVHLAKEMKLLNEEDFVAGLGARFEFMADESMDSPLCTQHYGNLLAHLFVEDVLKLADFPAIIEKMKEESNHMVGMLFKKTVEALKNSEEGKKVLAEQVESIPEDFISEYRLADTLA
mmetsp:Transcript_20829/g.40851  ORF Transcript_20829/g.40851 Transcript_20829/m.40851 type:complete len:1135 (-) Transcript_20829:40-3444(-)|eukprot:CAMPEP_0171499196 /NCGR_PEP_ID=MMETSP0958-20121227/8297_1 /TAXON_ID=87120 /ORGANISM="Aurantiochytrium limacinum, Strain ATCCMYA-1381" /LENGTH=1134 /DNA_ID=CAMNT_0012033731 /DNA_START=239 /DNA_END=3643 /DNA_ORIENTATION=-